MRRPFKIACVALSAAAVVTAMLTVRWHVQSRPPESRVLGLRNAPPENATTNLVDVNDDHSPDIMSVVGPEHCGTYIFVTNAWLLVTDGYFRGGFPRNDAGQPSTHAIPAKFRGSQHYVFLDGEWRESNKPGGR